MRFQYVRFVLRYVVVQDIQKCEHVVVYFKTRDVAVNCRIVGAFETSGHCFDKSKSATLSFVRQKPCEEAAPLCEVEPEFLVRQGYRMLYLAGLLLLSRRRMRAVRNGIVMEALWVSHWHMRYIAVV